MTNNTEAKDPVVSINAADTRRKMVWNKTQRVIDLYEKAIQLATTGANQSGTHASVTMNLVQEIIGNPNLHTEVMERAAVAFEAQGFRVVRTRGRLVYPTFTAEIQSVKLQEVMTFTVHW